MNFSSRLNLCSFIGTKYAEYSAYKNKPCFSRTLVMQRKPYVNKLHAVHTCQGRTHCHYPALLKCVHCTCLECLKTGTEFLLKTAFAEHEVGSLKHPHNRMVTIFFLLAQTILMCIIVAVSLCHITFNNMLHMWHIAHVLEIILEVLKFRQKSYISLKWNKGTKCAA